MANERKKYHFGSNELDYENYIKNLDHNVDTFLSSQNWNDDQKQEFINAYNNYISAYKSNESDRFSADAFGRITDNQGLLSSNDSINKYYDKKGKSIDAQTYSTLNDKEKKKYSGFNANTYVAKYFKDIAKGMIAKNPTASNKFDFNKHGFFKYWSDKINPAGGAFNMKPFVDKDELVNGRRSRTNRANYLADEIKTYRENLADYDFSENIFGSKEKYLEALSNFEKSLRDGTFDANDAQAALAAGINQDFFDQFFTEYDVYKTDEEAKKEQEEADKKQAQEERNKWVEAEYKKYNDNKTGYYDVDNGFTIGDYSVLFKNDDGSFNNQAFSDYFNQQNFGNYYVNGAFSPTAFGKKWLENPFDLNNTEHARHFIAGLIGKNLLSKIDSGKYNGMYYFGDSYSPNTNRVLVYDPTTGKVFYRFVGDIPKLWEDKIKQANLRGYAPTTDASAYYIKNGGNIPKNQFGGNIDVLFKQGYDADLEKRAKQKGNTIKQQRAAERYINSDYKTGDNDAGWETEEIARLTSAAADLGSAIAAFVPGAGTATSAVLGLGSTGSNLVADIADDSVSGWETVGNAAFGLGMDIVGLIPGLGMVGKGAKVARTLTKLAPKVMKWLWGYSALTNAPELIQSWEKMIDSESKMTSRDWENIMQSLNLILGGGAAYGRNLKAKGKMSTNAKEAPYVEKLVDDKIAVKMKDASGAEKRVVFEGDDAKAIREADGNIDEIKKHTIDKYQDLSDFTIVESMSPIKGLQSPVKGWKVWSSENYQSPYRKKAKVDDIYANDSGEFIDLKGEFGITRDFTHPGRTKKEIDDAFVESQIAPLRQASLDYEARLKDSPRMQTAIEKDINNLETKLGGRTSKAIADEIADVRLRYASYNKSAKATAKTNLQNIEAELKKIKNAEDFITKAENQLRKERLKRNPDQNVIDSLEYNIQRGQADLEALAGKKGSKKKKLIKEQTKYKKEIDDYTSLEKEVSQIKDKENLRKDLEKLEKSLAKLQERKIYWDKFKVDGKTDARLKFEQDYPVTDGNITFHDPNTNRDITRNFNEILRGIKFRKGGSIRKFQFAGKFPDLTIPKFESQPFKKSSFMDGVELMEDGTLQYRPKFTPTLMEDYSIQLTPTSENNTNFLLQPANKPTTPTVTDVNTGNEEGEGNTKTNHFSNFLSQLNNTFQNPTLKYGLPRAIADINTNNRMTDLAISAEKPILKQSLRLSPITMHSDLAGEMAAQKNSGLLTSMASQPFTSDGRLQQAAMFDSQLKGLDYTNQGKQKSDSVALDTAEKIKAQNDIEITKNLATANEDTAAMQATANNISKHKLAGMAKEQTIKDTLSQQFENDDRSNDALRESLFKKDQTQLELDNAINGNITGITDGQKAVLKKYKETGTTGLTDLEKQELNKVLAVINDRVLTNWANYKGISRSYTPTPLSTTTSNTIQYNYPYKKGGKLDNYKLILSAIKENNKKIEKLSSTMTNYFKDIKK